MQGPLHLRHTSTVCAKPQYDIRQICISPIVQAHVSAHWCNVQSYPKVINHVLATRVYASSVHKHREYFSEILSEREGRCTASAKGISLHSPLHVLT